MKIVTHSGRFHTDEVFSCAALSLLNKDNVSIVRSRDPEVWATANVLVDVGGEYDASQMKFDHHQAGGAGGRENGIPYSSFGLVWKHYGVALAGSEEIARAVDERLVQPIDAGDSGVETFSVLDETAPYLLQDVIGIFAPMWDEKNRTEDEGFFEVLEIAKKILVRAIVQAKSMNAGRLIVEEAYNNAKDKRIVLLEGQFPWHQAMSSHPEPLYVVLPERGETGRWRVEAVRKVPHTFQYRKNMPIEWAGKQNEDLAKITGVADAAFCHNHRFIAVAGSKEGAIKMATLAANA